MHAIFKNSHGNENKNCGITSAKCITTAKLRLSLCFTHQMHLLIYLLMAVAPLDARCSVFEGVGKYRQIA